MEELRYNKIDKAGNRTPFQVPEGYFDTLTDRIMQHIDEAEETPDKRGFNFYLRPIIGIAASILLVTLLIKFPIRMLTNKNQVVAENEQNVTTKIEVYANFSENEIVDALYETNGMAPQMDEVTMENVLLATVSEYELYGVTD